jgi:hypothetical protein
LTNTNFNNATLTFEIGETVLLDPLSNSPSNLPSGYIFLPGPPRLKRNS